MRWLSELGDVMGSELEIADALSLMGVYLDRLIRRHRAASIHRPSAQSPACFINSPHVATPFHSPLQPL